MILCLTRVVIQLGWVITIQVENIERTKKESCISNTKATLKRKNLHQHQAELGWMENEGKQQQAAINTRDTCRERAPHTYCPHTYSFPAISHTHLNIVSFVLFACLTEVDILSPPWFDAASFTRCLFQLDRYTHFVFSLVRLFVELSSLPCSHRTWWVGSISFSPFPAVGSNGTAEEREVSRKALRKLSVSCIFFCGKVGECGFGTGWLNHKKTLS